MTSDLSFSFLYQPREGGLGLLPYMGYMDTCHCEEYGFRAVYSGIGYVNQRV